MAIESTEYSEEIILRCVSKLAHLHGTFMGLPKDKLPNLDGLYPAADFNEVAGFLAGIAAKTPAWKAWREKLASDRPRKVFDYLLKYRRVMSEIYHKSQHNKSHVTIVHGDFHPGNWLVNESGDPLFADWQVSGYGTPFLDLSNVMLWTTGVRCPNTKQGRMDRYHSYIDQYIKVMHDSYQIDLTSDFVWEQIRWSLCLRPLVIMMGS